MRFLIGNIPDFQDDASNIIRDNNTSGYCPPIDSVELMREIVYQLQRFGHLLNIHPDDIKFIRKESDKEVVYSLEEMDCALEHNIEFRGIDAKAKR